MAFIAILSRTIAPRAVTSTWILSRILDSTSIADNPIPQAPVPQPPIPQPPIPQPPIPQAPVPHDQNPIVRNLHILFQLGNSGPVHATSEVIRR